MLTRQGDDATASEERTMRHALVPVHLIYQARPANPAQALTDAPASDPHARRVRRSRRLRVRRNPTRR
jgi:hypothetical protein